MFVNFGHHLMPLLPHSGTAGGLGGKAALAYVKEACKSTERIHGALALAGRVEVAFLPENPDFFDSAPAMAKARNLIWETIRTTPRLRWVIPTRNPSLISRSLPPTWIGRGFPNVCVGLVADYPDSFSEKLQALRSAPVRYRAIFLDPSSAAVDLRDQLDGLDWLVLAGTAADAPMASAMEALCRAAGVAFLFHGHVGDRTSEPQGDESASPPPHPFGEKIDLRKPTLRDLELPPVNERSDTSGLTDPAPPPSKSGNPEPVLEPPAELLDFEVVTLEPSIAEIGMGKPQSTGVSESDEADFTRLDGVVRQGLATFVDVGRALAVIRGRELWRIGDHPNWAAYCQRVGGLTKTHANRLINSAEIAERLVPVAPFGVTPTTESQVRALCKLQPEQQNQAWICAAERAKGQPTARLISEVVAELMSDEAPPSRTSPSRRNKIISLLSGLRSAVRKNLSAEVLEGLISELEQCLNVTAGEISR